MDLRYTQVDTRRPESSFMTSGSGMPIGESRPMRPLSGACQRGGLDRIEAMLAESHVTCGGHEAHTYGFVAAFCQPFPDYPGDRVRLRPSEACVASTDSMMHDACAEGQTSYDIQFSVLGHLRPQVGCVRPPAYANSKRT